VGLATARIALKETSDKTPPCRHAAPGWFGSQQADGLANRDAPASWRACLQLLTSGDYLSPTVLGLLLRDNLVPLFSEDRAALLEQAIERHYNRVVHGDGSLCQGRDDTRGFCSPMGYLKASLKDRWLPLLLLNATEIDTGRPVLMSDLDTATVICPGTHCEPFLPIAHNAFELSATNPNAKPENRADEAKGFLVPGLAGSNDMRLSTAAVLSARFPVLSPAGVFQYEDRRGRTHKTRVVDGGYFDNTGLETINQLIPFLVKQKLRPFVIYISNSPWADTPQQIPGRPIYNQPNGRILDLPTRWWDAGVFGRALSVISEPLSTLYSTGTGHVEMAKQRLLELVRDFKNVGYAVVRVRNPVTPVEGTMEKTSLCLDNPRHGKFGRVAIYPPVMSWWLSPVSQRALDAQLCDYNNNNEIQRVLRELSLATKAAPDQCDCDRQEKAIPGFGKEVPNVR
jgi:hypothetical protein